MHRDITGRVCIFLWHGAVTPCQAPGEHADKCNSLSTDLNLSFEPSPDYSGIAVAAGNAYGAVIETPDQVDPVLKEAVKTVQGGKSAVVEVR